MFELGVRADQELTPLFERLKDLANRPPSFCEYCGCLPGIHASCDHCGAPNPNHLEINGRLVTITTKPVDTKSFHYWPFS